jgi:hypothetical protein
MSFDAENRWLALLEVQHGIVGRQQALACGFTARQIESQLRTGKWQRVHDAVYATFSGRLSRDARLWAAVRRGGEGAMLSHETAAEVHGLLDKPAKVIHLTVASHRRPLQRKPVPGLVIHRSDLARPQFPVHVRQPPRTRIEDTVLDLIVAAGSFEEGYSWIARAVSRKLVTVAALRAAVAERKRVRWRAWLTDALADSAAGVSSSLELRYVKDVEQAHGLPEAERQARRTIGGRTHYKDNWYGEYQVAVEIDGPNYHQGDRREADKNRDNLNLAADAAQTFRFGPVQVTERACESAVLVAVVLRRNGWTGKPRPCPRPGCAIAGHKSPITDMPAGHARPV